MSDNSNNTEVAPWEDVPADGSFDEDSQAAVSDASVENDTTSDDTIVEPEKAMLIDEIATEYVGFWNRLVSQTNWEKGKVIYTWRTRLIDAGIPRNVYSDDSIAKRIGNVSGQHVGRLRRVYEQFGSEQQYPGLYWSHYQAALDWDDADEWLRKASDESLSVASMRIARWEKYGAPADRKPKESEIIASEPDEDVNPYNDSDSAIIDVGVPMNDNESGSKSDSESASTSGSKNDKNSGSGESTSGSKNDKNSESGASTPGSSDDKWSPSMTSGEVISAVAKLPELPEDLAVAFEELKIAILNNKVSKWSDVDPKD
ncbi:MAG: hypothetical protein Q4G59_05820, partial [Planctomycetia bacterium]|nr:hypothetical protein [Planctomycetia bacterium]